MIEPFLFEFNECLEFEFPPTIYIAAFVFEVRSSSIHPLKCYNPSTPPSAHFSGL